MHLYHDFAHAEVSGDLLVRLSGGYTENHFTLAGGKRGEAFL
jgi:hypothetical protein